MARRPTARNYHNIRKGWWNGMWFDSSWELAVIVYFHDHGMELTRNTKQFPYHWRRHIEYYQPDFILETGMYVEVKGIRDFRAKRKLEEFPYPIEVWGAKEMKPYLDYMDATYGKSWRDTLPGITGGLVTR